jgi:lipid-A-disaccharide synthase
VLILVDYPGFNLRIAEFARKQGLKVVYYISPQIWAWKQSRVKKIKRDVDKMLVILPFEKDFYGKHGVEVDFVGHPLLDSLAEEQVDSRADFLKKNQLNTSSIVALLPGSREMEVRNMLKIMLRVVNRFPERQFVIAGVSTLSDQLYENIIGKLPVKVLQNQTRELLFHAEAALVTSGTATLETALIGVPQVVCYKGNRLSFEIAKRIVKIKYISLVNLIMDRPVVKELIQQDLTVQNLEKELALLLSDEVVRKKMFSDYEELRIKLGSKGASERAAQVIEKYLAI